MPDGFNEFLIHVNTFIWGIPLMALILSGGIFLTIRLGLLQIRRLPLALRSIFSNEEAGTGEISSFAALCTSLSATIGTGNIVGVATAVSAGGPGALFWMIVAAVFGMATKYAEGLLAIKYRKIGSGRHILGGPFYYIELGMGQNWKWLAKYFAFFGMCAGLFGIGTISQVNGISNAIQNFFDPNESSCITLPLLGEHSWSVVISSLVLTSCVAAVLLGGIQRIANVSQVVVPFMAATYFLFTAALILFHIASIPDALMTIIREAFHPSAIAGGAAGSIFVVIQKGISRGIFSNEAGLGSSPIAAAAARTKEPVRQGLVSMTGTFIDTIIICTLTGLSIVITGAWQAEGLEGVQITAYAFEKGLPFPSQLIRFILMLCLVFFAFTSILGWNYYSECCLEYLTNGNRKSILTFRRLYIFAVFIGSFLTVRAAWTIADIFNGLMAVPNMIALFALSGVTAKETRRFFQARKNQ